MKLCNFPLGEKVKTSFILHESCLGIVQRDGFSSRFFTWSVAILQRTDPDSTELPSALLLNSSQAALEPLG